MELYHRIFEFTPDALLVVAEDGRITRANSQVERLFGYAPPDLLGNTIEVLIPERYAAGHVANRARYVAEPRIRTMGSGLELYGRRKDGSEFPVDIMLGPLPGSGDTAILCVVRDVTERVKADQRLRESLREKEVLLQEIHHRVKNNLAVMSDLFYLESTYAKDETIERILLESQGRVQSMALVHETLYRSRSLSAVDFGEYARELCTALLQTYERRSGELALEREDGRIRAYENSGNAIRFQPELMSVEMGIDLAVPCGLILNELLTNAFRHAFPGGRAGVVAVGVTQSGGSCILTVSDDGVGFPSGFDFERSSTLGLRLVKILARQVRGEASWTPLEPGTQARFVVPLEAG